MLRAFQRHTNIFLRASQGTGAASEDVGEESETNSEEAGRETNSEEAGRESEMELLVEEAWQGEGS